MDFIIGILNSIYNMVKSILKSAGIDTDGWNDDLIPTEPKAK